jgi:hypothetical protein
LDYRFRLFGPDERVFADVPLQAEDDFSAMEAAWRLYRRSVVPHHGFELRRGSRLIDAAHPAHRTTLRERDRV